MRVVCALFLAFVAVTTSTASEYKAGSIVVSNPWSRATPKGAQTAIGYMTITNKGQTSDRLIGGSIDVASTFQLHTMSMENGVAKMRELNNIEIKPGETIRFEPGGSHLMFVNLKHPLDKDEQMSGTLNFEHAGKVKIEYSVEGMGAQTGPGSMEHMGH